MKNKTNLTTDFTSSLSERDNTNQVIESLKSKAWALKLFGKYDCFGNEYLVGKLKVFKNEDIYLISAMMFRKIPNLLRVDISMEYELDE